MQIEISLKPKTKATYIVRIDRQWPQKMPGAQILSLVNGGATVTPNSQVHLDAIRAMTPAQVARQRARRSNGQYEEMNDCYCCGKRLGQDYASDRRTDCDDSEGNHWGDVALCLCDKCATELDKLPDGEAFAIASGDKPRPWARKPRQPK